MESELKQKKLELLRKELAKKKLKLKKQECRKSAKDHVRQKIKEQTELYSLPRNHSLCVDTTSNTSIATGPADCSPSISVDEQSLVENPRKCVSFKLTPVVQVSMSGDAVDGEEEEDRVKNFNLGSQSDLINSDLVEQKTFINDGDLLTFDSVNCDPIVTSHSQVSSSGQGNAICLQVSCVSASSVNTIQHYLQQNDFTLEAEQNQEAGFFLNGREHSEEMFAPDDIKSCRTMFQCAETADYGLEGENWTAAELESCRSNDKMITTTVTSGLKGSADHSKEFVKRADCILKETDGCQFNRHHAIYSNLQSNIPLSRSHNEPADLVSGKGGKMDECVLSQKTWGPVGNSITNGQEDCLGTLNFGVYSDPLILSCNEKEVLEKDISMQEIVMGGTSIEKDRLDMEGRLQNPKQSGYSLAENSQKQELRSTKTLCTQAELEKSQSGSENYKFQKEPDSMTEFNIEDFVHKDLLAPDNISKHNQLLQTLPISTSCLGSQQADISSTKLPIACCMVSETKTNLNSDSFSTSDLSFLDEEDNDDLYSRVKARRRGGSTKRSSVHKTPLMQTWTSDKSQLLALVDDELMSKSEADSVKSSCTKFAIQRDRKYFKKDSENNRVGESSIVSDSNSGWQSSINLEDNESTAKQQSTFPKCSINLSGKHDYLAGSSKQFAIENSSKFLKTSLQSNSERHSTCSTENSIGASSWEAFSNSETDKHDESSGRDVVTLTGKKHVKRSSENSSVKQSSVTDNLVADSSAGDLSSSSLKRVRRSGRLKGKADSEQRGLCSSREVLSSLPDVDAIKHVLEVVRHNVMDKSQFSEEFSLPDIEYHGSRNVQCSSVFVSQSSLSSQTVENSIQGSVGNLLEADCNIICVSTVNGVKERDVNSTDIPVNKLPEVAQMRHDINASSTNDFIGTTRDSLQVTDDANKKMLNTSAQHHDLNTSELVKDLSNKQSESAYLYTDSVELLGKNSWNIRIEEKISLQTSFEGPTITAGCWSLSDDLGKIPVIICCHGNGITMYRKDKSEWSLWFTWNASTFMCDIGGQDRSVISAWPLHHDGSGIFCLLVISGSVQETCVEVVVFGSSKEQRCLTVDRRDAGEQVRVCVLTEGAFCIGTLFNDQSNEWEVMPYSLSADCFAIMPGLALEVKIFHLMCMAAIPEESCVCGFSSSEVVIWHFPTGSLLQKISLNFGFHHCPCVFHENGLLFLPCFLNNSNASGCLVVLNPVSSKTLILLEYISPPNDLKQACRFTSSGVGDEFLFAVTDNGTLLLWSLLSGALVAMSSGIHVKSATLLKQDTLVVLISNRIITVQLTLSKKQSVNNKVIVSLNQVFNTECHK